MHPLLSGFLDYLLKLNFITITVLNKLFIYLYRVYPTNTSRIYLEYKIMEL